MPLSLIQTLHPLLFLIIHSLADDFSSGLQAGTDTASFPNFSPLDESLGSPIFISGLAMDGANSDQQRKFSDSLNDGNLLVSENDGCSDTPIPRGKRIRRQNCGHLAPGGTITPKTNGGGKPPPEPNPQPPLQITPLQTPQSFKEDRTRCNHLLTNIPVCALSSDAKYSTPLYTGISFFDLPACHICA